jgi:hypothetical protein
MLYGSMNRIAPMMKAMVMARSKEARELMKAQGLRALD